MAQPVSKVTWLVRLLEELKVSNATSVTVNYDNQSTLHIAHNSVFHERTKHIEIYCQGQST